MSSARVIKAEEQGAIKEAAGIIRSGGLVAFPTETVYGLGADTENAEAVARIFEAKARPRIDPLIVHVADTECAHRYGRFPESAQELMAKFWPGPLTIIVNKERSVPAIVTAGLDTVALRVPAHPAALALIREAGHGIAAPSANPFGYVSPTAAEHVAEQLGNAIELILDGGPCALGLESTILSLVDPEPCILRVGGTTIEDLEPILGCVKVLTRNRQRPLAPGQLVRHYATHTLLEIADESGEELDPGKRVGLLSLAPPENPLKYAAVEALSLSGNLREAAANLFSALRRLDSLRLDKIIARPVEEKGLGVAIMDRLRRCSARNNSQTSVTAGVIPDA